MMRKTLLIFVLLVACGCASKPKPPSPQVQSEITSRLSDFSAAWFAGDGAGVARSFAQRAPDERDFAQSLGQLAVVQKGLLKVQHTVPESITSTVPMSDMVPMVTLNRPWHYYAYAASRPPQDMFKKKDMVAVQMIQGGEYTSQLREVDGKWLIEPQGWAKDKPVGALTDSVRRQATLTAHATDAIRAKDWERLKLVLQQMHQQRMVDRISDSTNLQIP